MKTLWDDTHLSVDDKADRVEFLLRNKYKPNCNRIIKVPSSKYPLPGKNYIIGVSDTASPICDTATLSILDNVQYFPGQPCKNALNTAKEFKKHNYDIRVYIGWLFDGDIESPVPYCWCMLEDSIIDLAETTQCVNEIRARLIIESTLPSKKNQRQNINNIAFESIKMANQLPNHIRCHPVGIPDEKKAYIGTECIPEECEAQYRELLSYAYGTKEKSDDLSYTLSMAV